MLKKISLLVLLGLIYSFSALAVPNDEEYTKCLKNTATDAGVAKCHKDELEAVKKEINQIKNEIRPDLSQEQLKNLNEMDKYFSKYTYSYCFYYTQANQGNGYSDNYNSVWCQLLAYLDYYRKLETIKNFIEVDIKG